MAVPLGEYVYLRNQIPPCGPLVGSQEVGREAQVVVDLDQQVRQPDGGHVTGQPAFQAMQPGFRVRGQAL